MKAKIQTTAKPMMWQKRVTTLDGGDMSHVLMNPAATNLVIPVSIPVAANSDLFEDWAPDYLDLLGLDELVWEDEVPEIEEIPDIEEVWSRVEDIWLRLARHPEIACATLIDAAQGDRLVMFHPKSGATDCKAAMLLELAACSGTYAWCEGGRHGSLVSHMAWCGNSLVIDLASFEKMQAWPDGQSLVWQMQTLLGRMRELGDCA